MIKSSHVSGRRFRQQSRLVLGISDSITSGAALVASGRVIAAVNEERLNRMKMAMGWPRRAIEEVLRMAGVDPRDVDEVAIATRHLFWRPEAQPLEGYFDEHTWSWDKRLMMRFASTGAKLFGSVPAARSPYYQAKSLLGYRRRLAVRGELRQLGMRAPHVFIDHHLAHAASAYYTGGKANATIVTLDGAGDHLSSTVYQGSEGMLQRVATNSSYDSIGNFYSYVTHILGFHAHKHEGKITGLAAYGQPRYADLFRGLVRFRAGRIENLARAFHHSAIGKIRRLLPSNADRADVAASIQLVLEEVCADFVDHWVRKLGHEHLGLAGGVVANVKLNQKLFELDSVRSIFVHPGMGDDGLAVGAALQRSAELLPASAREHAVYRMADVYLGPRYGSREIEQAVAAESLPARRPDDLAAEIARLLAAGHVVARFSGAMEYGPRALGNRSILVHAGDPTVNDWLNKRLRRTEFMPFAPVSLADEAEQLYQNLSGAEHSAQFMTITFNCTSRLKQTCPAVVHVDGTARPQLVGADGDAGYRAILQEYRKLTGFSTVINTSFNMHEEPIVCSPEDAVRAFTAGGLDYLAIGDYLLRHPRSGETQGRSVKLAARAPA